LGSSWENLSPLFLACSWGFTGAVGLLGNQLFAVAIIDCAVWHIIGVIVLLMAVKLYEREESCNGFILRVGICRVPVL